MPKSFNDHLSGENLRRADVHQAWEQDNQAWWDWYVSLADDDAEELGSVETPSTPPLPDCAPAGDDELRLELTTPYALSSETIALFRHRGYVKLRNVLSPGAVVRLRQVLVEQLEKTFAATLDGGVTGRFLSLELAWLSDPIIRAFVLSPRIGQIAARLLEVPAVRLYHDNILSKEPHCGPTPWHYDATHFPLATNDVITAWIPAQPISRAMGPLAFAHPIDVYTLTRNIPFNKYDTSYDREVRRCFHHHRVSVDATPFELGEVSFHHNLSFHTASSNRATHSRIVLANTYFADGARVVDEPTMISGDWRKFLPDVEPGDVAASPLNPVCWSSDSDYE